MLTKLTKLSVSQHGELIRLFLKVVFIKLKKMSFKLAAICDPAYQLLEPDPTYNKSSPLMK